MTPPGEPDPAAGRVALITGGGRGIGRGIAEVFAAAGIATALAGRDRGALEATVEAVVAAGGEASAHVCDVAEESSVEECVAAVLERHGRIDVLVNNAGIAGPTAPLADLPVAEWDRVQATNVRGSFLCTRAVASGMIARGSGHVLFVSALGGGLRAYPLRLAYATSKAAMLAMMQTLAAELGPHGIRVNAVTPGPVQGERLDRVFASRAEQTGASSEAVAAKLAERVPVGSFPDALEIGRVALFLCSAGADHVVGQSLNVTGGIEIMQ